MNTPDESITAEPQPPAAAAADEAPIPLPPPAAPPPAPVVQDDPGLRLRLARLDVLLTVLVLVLAFLLGSFAATNSDVWLHLALGRDLLNGTYQFGVDPYSFTTEGVYWVNHSWLFDVLSYGLYSLFGGGVAVVVKALLVALTAWLLAAQRRADQSAWLPLAVTALAVLVMSPRFAYQPAVLSYLFLAVTLFVLVRTSPADVGTPLRISPWWLVALCALWANCDHWFWLGPLTIGLFALGEWLQRLAPLDRAAPPPRERVRTLGLVCVAGLAACVLNPHHVRVFTLPTELAQIVAGLPLPADFVAEGLGINRLQEYDPGHLRYYAASPFQGEYFQAGMPGKTVAGLAYYLLLLLGLASFGLGLRVGVLRYWRVLVWLVPALLSVFQVRLIPLFAAMAVPATVLNLQDFAARWSDGTVRVPRGWALGGRLGTAVALLALAALAWPGWLNPLGVASPYTPRSPRRVAWHFEEDPGLKEAALAVGTLRQSGELKNGFNFAGDVAHYAVWLVPGYKEYYDYRFGLFAHQAETVGKIRGEFQDELRGFNPFKPARAGTTWRREFRDKQVNYVILSWPAAADPNRGLGLARRFYLDRREWVLLFDNGRAAIAGWRGPKRAEQFAGLPRPLTRDARRAAFGPTPANGPPLGPEVNLPTRTWTPLDDWNDYAHGQPPIPLAFSEAVSHLQMFSDGVDFDQALLAQLLGATPAESPWTVAALAGPLLTPGAGVAGRPAALAGLLGSFLFGGPEDPGPVAHLVVALRKARESLNQDPNNAAAYMALFQIYHTLANAVEDVWRRQQLRPTTEFALVELRGVQIMVALNAVIDLEPDNVDARRVLAQYYIRSHFFDAAIEQLTEARRLMELKRGQIPPENAKAFEQLLKSVETDHKRLSAEVSARRGSYLLKAERLKPDEKYFAAMQERYTPPGAQPGQADPRGRGLPLEALKALRGADRDKLKDAEREKLDTGLVSLLLRLGKLRELNELPFSKHILEETEHSPRLLALYAPAVGNYVEADKALAVVEQRFARDNKAFAVLAGDLLGNLLLQHEPELNPLRELFRSLRRDAVKTRLAQLQGEMARRAEIQLLRGVLALEQGDTDKALALLRGCLALTDLGDGPEARAAARFVFSDRRIAERLVDHLEAARRP